MPAGLPANGAEKLHGHLYKQSPSALKFYKYHWRYVTIEDGKLYWWKDAETAREYGVEGCSGVIDLVQNRCRFQEDEQDNSRFALLPGETGWVQGFFAGSGSNRTFLFDARKSEHSRDTWFASLQQHSKVQEDVVDQEPAEKPISSTDAASEENEAQIMSLNEFIADVTTTSCGHYDTRLTCSIGDDDDDTSRTPSGKDAVRRSSLEDRYEAIAMLNEAALQQKDTEREESDDIVKQRAATIVYALDDESESSDDGAGLRGQGSPGHSFGRAFDAMDDPNSFPEHDAVADAAGYAAAT
jgi:hypothetical protein